MNSKKTTVILLSGKSGSGKDFIANIMKQQLEENGNKVLVTHYADLLKYILKTFFNWDGQKDEKGRALLQRVGTDVIRRQEPDYWVNFVSQMISFFYNEWDYILIPDARFPNEIEVIKNNHNVNTITIRIHRPNYKSKLTLKQQQHPSETSLDNYKFDYYFNNTGTDDVNDAIKEFVDYIDEDNKQKPTLFCDLDCVLLDTVRAVVSMYDEDFHDKPGYKKVDWTKIDSWEFVELSLADKETIDGYFNQQRFFDRVDMTPGAKESINYLSNFYNIVFVSHGEDLNLHLKEKYINKHFPYAKFIGVKLSEHYDKSCVDMLGKGNVFIDDIPKNILGSNADIRICFGKDYEWNKNFEQNFESKLNNGVCRLYDWKGVIQLLKTRGNIK